MRYQIGTQVLGLGLESDSSPDFVGLGLESGISGLELDSKHVDSDLIRQTRS